MTRDNLTEARQALARAQALLETVEQSPIAAGAEPTGRDQLAQQDQTQARGRILAAAKVDPETLSDQARRIVDWLADWDTPTVEGVIELVTTARMAVYLECHRADIADKNQAVMDSSARLDAAMARYDATFGAESPGVGL